MSENIDLSWEGYPNNTRNDDSLFDEFKKLIKLFNIKKIYETGTFLGGTTERLSSFDIEIFTVEFIEKYYIKARDRLEKYTNIKIFNEDSKEFFKSNLIENDKNVLFFLDAHGFGGSFPIHNELEIIALKKIKPPVIVIHDFKTNFRKNGGYDMGLDLDSLTSFFIKIYEKFSYYFIENKGTSFRGSGIFFPKEQ